jgi:hypothetical protein
MTSSIRQYEVIVQLAVKYIVNVVVLFVLGSKLNVVLTSITIDC